MLIIIIIIIINIHIIIIIVIINVSSARPWSSPSGVASRLTSSRSSVARPPTYIYIYIYT